MACAAISPLVCKIYTLVDEFFQLHRESFKRVFKYLVFKDQENVIHTLRNVEFTSILPK